MSPVHSRREFSDGLLKRLAAQPKARPVSGDFAMVCTDLVADTWELFPIALVMTDGTVLQLYDERGGLLSFERVSEREQGLTASAATFPDIEAVRALCWLPFDGLATMRRRLARISAVAE